VLAYSKFRHFLPVIEKAREACLNSAHRVEDQTLEMVSIGSGAQRPVED
jgi:DNA-damage-inducible protein D